MKTKITHLILIFENCQTLKIPMNDIRYISINKVYEMFNINNFYTDSECNIEIVKIANEVTLYIKDSPENARIKFKNDISHIELINDNDKEYMNSFGILWDGNFDEANPNQKFDIYKDEIRIYIKN